MQRQKPKLTENKLLMLYAIDRLGGVTNNQALRFFIENDFMDYIDVQLSLAELTDGRLLSVINEPLGNTYELTEFGLDAIDFFKSRVPASRRRAVDEAVPRWREAFFRETQVFADYTTALNGDTIARLSAREDGELLFEMNISVETPAQAQILCDNWRKSSAEVYKAVMDILSRAEKSDSSK